MSVPASVVVAAGATKMTFPVVTSAGGSDVTAEIAASMSGASSSARVDTWTVLPTSINWISQPGSSGNGQWDRLTPANASFSTRCEGSDLTLQVLGPAGRVVQLTMGAPRGTPLIPGTYENAERASNRRVGVPGLDIGVNGAACAFVAGRFVVTAADLDPNGQVRRFMASFDVTCGQGNVSGDVRLTGPFPLPPFAISCIR